MSDTIVSKQTAGAVNASLDSLLVRILIARLERLEASLTVARRESRRDWELALQGAQNELRELLNDARNQFYGSAAE
jgi:hypothetical protein